jgi:GTP-binding protein
VFVLVDGEVGPTKLDLQMVDWLRGEAIPCRIVATKIDKVSPSRALKQRKDVAAALFLLPNDIAWTSTSKGVGIQELRREVASLLEIKA